MSACVYEPGMRVHTSIYVQSRTFVHTHVFVIILCITGLFFYTCYRLLHIYHVLLCMNIHTPTLTPGTESCVHKQVFVHSQVCT